MPTDKAGAEPIALYRTANINLAAYLVASGRLTLDHIEPATRHSEFFFRDPEGIGSDIADEYITEDLKVSAKLLLEARASLLHTIRREIGNA